MAKERIFNFNEGCHVTFNDIHDNTNCTIYTAKQPKQPNSIDINLPRENDYKAVVEWLQVEKDAGRDWYAMNSNNRVRMCTQLSKVLGWIVDANSLGHAINRK